MEAVVLGGTVLVACNRFSKIDYNVLNCSITVSYSITVLALGHDPSSDAQMDKEASKLRHGNSSQLQGLVVGGPVLL